MFQTNPVGVKLGVSYVNAFFCIDAAATRVKTLSWLSPFSSEYRASCRWKWFMRIPGQELLTNCDSKFVTLKTFFTYFFPFDHSYYSDLPLILLSWPTTLMNSFFLVFRLGNVHKQKSVVYIHNKLKQLTSNVSNLVLTWISEHWSSIANVFTQNDKEWWHRQGRSTCHRGTGE